MSNGSSSSASAKEPKFLFKVADKELKVFGFTAIEKISSPYDVRLTLVSEKEVSFDDVLGKAGLLTILVEDSTRYFHGIISQFSQAGKSSRFYLYRARLVPAVWRLSLEQDCRIFQDKKIEDIIKEILNDAKIPSDQCDFRLQGSYEKKVYCVQYRETDLNFISRLMEESGIFYFFEHSKDKHVLVFGDGTVNYKPISGDAKVTFSDAESMVPDKEFVRAFGMSQQLHTGKVSIKDFDFNKPDLDLTAKKEDSDNKELEVYDYPAEYVDQGQGKKIAAVRLEEAVMYKKTAQGESNCCRFVPGFSFTLQNHELKSLNQDYLLVEITHIGTQPQVLVEKSGQGGSDYSNEMMVIPASVTYRPKRYTPKPIVEGIQTAIVVGPKNEEIYTDEYGRVKVQFHWDRMGKRDDKSSCWIRVSYGWAGGNYGYFVLPRIGQEVIVSFIEGDPDRPVITGRVYNADHMPPYELPANKTRSTIKTKTHKGDGANEIRFEDKSGEEELYIHGQKDLNIFVTNDRATNVGNNQHLTVGKGSNTKVGENSSVTVGGDESVSVGGQRSVKVGSHVITECGADQGGKVSGNYSLKVGGDILIEAGGTITLKGSGGFIKIDSNVSIEGAKVLINSGGSAGSASIGGNLKDPVTPTETKATTSGSDTVYTPPAVAKRTPPPGAVPVQPQTPPGEDDDDEEPTWIKFKIVDKDDKAMKGVKMRLRLPDDTVKVSGGSGKDGMVVMDPIKQGDHKCHVREIMADEDMEVVEIK